MPTIYNSIILLKKYLFKIANPIRSGKSILFRLKKYKNAINERNKFIKLFWNYQLTLKLLFTRKIKVGFGPITTGENDLGVRKWRIDPIINQINKTSKYYAAGFFVHLREMKKFDIIIIVKYFNVRDAALITELKHQNKKFIYDIVDNPNAEKQYSRYFADAPEFSSKMDGFIISSPAHEKEACVFSDKLALIEHPIISNIHKINTVSKNSITLIAHGYYENLNNLTFIEPIIDQLSKETGKTIQLIYHSEVVHKDKENIKYIKWTVDNCFESLLNADIAISVKKNYMRHQRTKPSTKLITFMAAGLPVICTPTPADLLVINTGRNGFCAYTYDDWIRYIRLLVCNDKLRNQIAKTARADVLRKYSINEITKKYIQLFDSISV